VTHSHRHGSAVVLFVALLSSLAIGCQSGPKVTTTVERGPDGVVMVQTVEMRATVEAIDATNRTLRLKPRRGESRTIKVGTWDDNFKNTKVGDEVHAVFVEETAISLVRGGAADSVGAVQAVKLAPVGGKSGVLIAGSVEVTGTIVAIDGHDHTLTIEFADGRVREIDVAKDRDLSEVALGDSVRVVLTEAVAVSVVKPN
jgi:hypothetical protein